MGKGRKAEAKLLTRAVKLYCDNRLVLRRGKVIDYRHAPSNGAASEGILQSLEIKPSRTSVFLGLPSVQEPLVGP